MKSKLSTFLMAQGAAKTMAALEAELAAVGLEPSLVALMKVRAAQIDGCAYCRDAHSRDAGAAGEAAARIEQLEAWRDSSLYSEREKAALTWAEAVARIASNPASDTMFHTVHEQFSEDQLVKLTMLMIAVEAWHRIAINFRMLHPLAPQAAA